MKSLGGISICAAYRLLQGIKQPIDHRTSHVSHVQRDRYKHCRLVDADFSAQGKACTSPGVESIDCKSTFYAVLTAIACEMRV
jgi:hypothetical protein